MTLTTRRTLRTNLHAAIRVLPDWILPAVGLLILVGALWLPFGLKRPDRMEGWVIMNEIEQQNTPISQNLDGTGRPLLLLPWFTAHWLDANSFFGAHVLLMALVFGKGLTLFLLLRRLFPGKALFAFLTAALVIVYPSDTGVVDTHILNIHTAIWFYVLSVYLLVVFWQSRRRWTGAILAGAMIALIISLAIYEIVYPLVAVTPLLLVWLDKRLSRRLLVTAAIWYMGPLLYAVYWLRVSIGTLPDYQAKYLSSAATPSVAVQQIFSGVVHAYQQNLWDGWLTALQQINTGYLRLTVITAVAVAAIGWLSTRKTSREPSRQTPGLIAAGMVILFLGFAPYAITTLRLDTWRVFLYASFGAALMVTALAQWIASWFPARNAVLTVLITPLLALGIHAALSDQRDFAANSLAQEQILAAMVKQAPKVAHNTLILLMDDPADTGALGTFWANFYFDNAVRFLYGDETLHARICYPNLPTWGDWQDRCQLQDQQVVLEGGGFSTALNIPYDRVLAFRYSSVSGVVLLWDIPSVYQPGSGSTSYDPHQVVDFASDLPWRVYTLFPVWPVPRSDAPPQPPAIADGESIALGRRWYSPESDGQQSFQWIDNDAEFVVAAQKQAYVGLQMEIGPGPGVAYQPFSLIVLDSANQVVAISAVTTQQTIEMALPVRAGAATVFRLHVEGGGSTIPGDSRILNFRVFHLRLVLPLF